MTRRHRLGLALRLLARDWRAGELRVLIAALLIAVAASTTIGFFTERLARGMVGQSAEFLGADLLLLSSRPVPPDWLDQARRHDLQVAETLEFVSMLIHGDQLQLASIKAVDDRYPLRGALRIGDAAYAADRPVTHGPARGEAWVAPRLLARLGLQPGDTVEVGELPLTVTRLVTFEPGQAGDFFGMQPRLMMNLADVPATGVVQPGSRISYQYLFAGEATAVAAYRAGLEPRLGPSQELLGVHEGRRSVGTALQRAERFLGLAVLIAIVLAGVAIAMAARRYSQRHFDSSAMLRCLGVTQNELLQLYLAQLLILGVLASAAGGALGWLAQLGLSQLLADLLPVATAPATAWPLLAGFATGLLVLGGFALPPILRLRTVPPLRVLRRELEPLPASAWLVYGIALAAVLALMWRYTGDWRLTFSLLLGALAVLTVLTLLGLLLLALGQGLNRRVGVAWRFGLNNLWRRRRANLSQVLAFGLTLMAMASLTLLRTDLLDNWRQQLPADTPNHFAINILPDRVAALEAFLEQHRVRRSALYPLVRGRLTAINGTEVRAAVSKEARSDNALNRELNLTWSDALQSDNRILAGRWWNASDAGKPLVSVESRLAERLGIALDDELSFSVGDRRIRARVASIRSVQWDSFRPNFYMIFPPGVLDGLPATYMTSFHLAATDKPLLRELVEQFPAVTVLELDLIIQQVERILGQVTLAVEYVLLFVLLAGLAVLFAAIQASLDERLYEGALLRSLGAGSRQLRAGLLSEFAGLGLLAGLVAVIGTECINWALYTRVLQLDYAVNGWLWLVLPAIGALLVGAAGYWGTRPVLNQSPLRVLRER